MLGTEEHGAASKREALRDIFSKGFLAKVTLCAIATASLISSVLNVTFVQWNNRQNSFEHKEFMRLGLAYERLTNDEARMEWAQLSELVGSAAFVQSYYLVFFGGLICK
jgi:hypothetical protein